MSRVPEQAPLTVLVARLARRRLHAQMVWGMLWTLLGVAALAVLLGGRFSERTTVFALAAGIVAAVVVVCVFWRRSRRTAQLRRFCREFQRDFPEDRDALETALELEASAERCGDFQKEYLLELQERYLRDDGQALRNAPSWRPRWRPALMVAVLCGIGVLGWLGRDAWSRCGNALFGSPAVKVAEGLAKVPVHSDVEIAAEVLRYGTEGGVWLESVEDGVRRKEAMSVDGTGVWRLKFYDLTADVRYRVSTSYASSPWRRLAVYEPPAPLAVSVVSVPPAYMKREGQSYDHFQNLELMEGEELRISCEMPVGQSWSLQEEKGAALVPPVEFLPRHRAVYRARYQKDDVDAWGESFQVLVRPDQAPLIELVLPEEDSQITPKDMPKVVAMTSDDFGVTEVTLHFVKDDAPEQTAVLWQGEARENVDVDRAMELGELEAGQIITGWLEARDNREPLRHASRSTLFFLTVMPPPEEGPDGQENGQSGEKQEVALDDLITESKRLLRNTLDCISRAEILSPEVARREQQELSRDLRALAVAVMGRQVAVAKNAGVAQLPPELAQYFVGAAQSLEAAAGLVDKQAVPESRKPQQSALSQLTRLAWLLMQNTQMQSTAEGGQQSQNSGESQEGQKESESQKGDRSFDMQQLQQTLEEVRRIRREQQQLLEKRLDASQQAERERQLAGRTNHAAEQVAGIASAASAVPPLREGVRELLGAADNWTTGDLANAEIRARRAEQALGVAEDLLEVALRKESQEQLSRLAQKASELSEKQRQLAEQSKEHQSKGADAAEKKAAREAQSALQAESQQFREETSAALQSLMRQYPEAAAALAQAMQSAAAEETAKAQTRANNALLYGRFDKAEQSQKQAADALEQWRDDLTAAGEGMPRFTPEELQAALEELQKQMEELSQAMSVEEQQNARREAQQALQKYGEQFRSSDLQSLGEAVAQGSREEALAALESARTLLREELLKMQGAETTGILHRQTAPVPPKYRRQTQEYFRRLK